MAEADITTIANTADGSSGYGAALRGAMSTLQTRVKPADVATEVSTALKEGRYLHTQTHSASGALAIDWADGNYFRVNSAGHNITGVSQSNGPSGGEMRSGIVEIVNTHGSTTITVDLTSIGMAESFTIAPAASQIVWLIATPSL
jgi:hypothetical protein